MEARDLFIFLGAGASSCPPSGLPMFNPIRDEILRQLEVSVAPGSAASVLAGLAPEPFLQAVEVSGVQLQPWLADVLGRGEPNAVHVAVAQLCRAGARVWTVNFDTLLERAGAGAGVAWPDSPTDQAGPLHVHGRLGGRLILTSEQVLAGLDPAWAERLRADVAGRVVVFLGYSGRDLDLGLIWDEVLTSAKQVVWFGLPPSADESHSLMLRSLAAAGKATLLVSSPRPGRDANPSWDFVDWCQRQGLVTLDAGLVAQLDASRAPVEYPRLRGAIPVAAAAVSGLLGDHRAARRTYLRELARLRYVRAAVRGLTDHVLNHGARLVTAAMVVAYLVPAVDPIRSTVERVRRKRVAALARLGRYRAVLRATRRAAHRQHSTLLLLRSASVRCTGSLDEAAAVAAQAYDLAVAERHPVRTAHAAFQQCIALQWSERVDEARHCLDTKLRPAAAIAASRWVGWADFIDGCLLVRRRDAAAALHAFDRGQARFEAEGLRDGTISILLGKLSAHRCAGDDDAFTAVLAQIEELRRGGDGMYYTRGHRFTTDAIMIELGEFHRLHTRRLDEAWRFYSEVARSPYPLQSSLGLLGLAMLERARGEEPVHAHPALRKAELTGTRLVLAAAAATLALPPGAEHPEVFHV